MSHDGVRTVRPLDVPRGVANMVITSAPHAVAKLASNETSRRCTNDVTARNANMPRALLKTQLVVRRAVHA